MKLTKAELLKNTKGKWYWHIKAKNGRVLAHSESYSSLSMAKKGLNSLLRAVMMNKVVIFIGG